VAEKKTLPPPPTPPVPAPEPESESEAPSIDVEALKAELLEQLKAQTEAAVAELKAENELLRTTLAEQEDEVRRFTEVQQAEESKPLSKRDRATLEALKTALDGRPNSQLRVKNTFRFTEVRRVGGRKGLRKITQPVLATIYRGQMIPRILEAAARTGNLNQLEVL